ncbi:hypothetical protein J2S98_002850 [Arthrobacter oryzae]|uniref:DUF3027 domain-containing protein n=1 Tax=Arthrobacter TaxID=1663 RepID=UPI001F48573C|nr:MULTISPECIES: DUF3027 domain-containing protein [Arthrobacter]MDP9987683.1 hypothetical protein [Arthrobacter oryzae]UKA72028.1 DUF3027 domain-containing protein [Arthrobacter sp. FW306-06-A]
MNPQSEQPGAPVQEQAAKTPPKRKAGVPVWRTGKPDAFLAAAVDAARSAVESITPAATIGAHLAAKSEGDRLVTHLFESRLPGYAGWQWYAVLTRNSRSKVVTVNELGLLPSEDSILAPEWVPWAERVRPEDEQPQEPEAGGHETEAQETDGQENGGPLTAEPAEAADGHAAEGDPGPAGESADDDGAQAGA